MTSPTKSTWISEVLLRIPLRLDLHNQYPSILAPEQKVWRVAVPLVIYSLVPEPKVGLFRTADGSGIVDVFNSLRTFPDRGKEFVEKRLFIGRVEVMRGIVKAERVPPGDRRSNADITYLFVDGIAERLHLGQPREAVLAAWGILADGKKALLHLAPGTKEDTASCREFFQDMGRRGLPDPLLVVSDGAPGVIRALEECFPRALRQRCLAHKMRNLQSKVPDDIWPEFHARARACYQAASPALARLLRDDIVATYDGDLPSAVACLEDDFEACIAHLRFPLAHRRAIRTTNLLERLFGEERRRTKVIPHAFGERAVLKLMYAALIRAAERWRAVKVTEFERRQMTAVRQDLDQEYQARTGFKAKPSSEDSQTKISSTSRTDPGELFVGVCLARERGECDLDCLRVVVLTGGVT